MELEHLLAAVDHQATADDLSGIDVTSVTHDSRAVTPGALFCCVPGLERDGHDYAAGAVEQGAVALLVERRLPLDIAQAVVGSVRQAMGPLAATFWGHPSRSMQVVGVTGTNGKTTTVHLLASIMAAAGRRATVIGTLTGARTTPEATELQAQLAARRDESVDVVAMEVSSHALAMHRVAGIHFEVAIFTNLSREHLDFHSSMEEYFAAKARLFEPDLAERAIVNLDDPHGRLLLDAARIPTEGYSLDELTDLELRATGSTFRWRDTEMHLALGGRFNVSNALAAAKAADALGVPLAAIAEGLGQVTAPSGRFELVDAGQPFRVVVDYAHTPDGLENVLTAAREVAGTDARVLVVFGCGGDRDPTKRPAMGRVATEIADQVVLTSDNPRSEDPEAIIEQVTQGINDRSAIVIEPDRAAAIARILALAGPGDVVVIAGKGHETTQVIGAQEIPFDDRLVARAELVRLGAAAEAGGAPW